MQKRTNVRFDARVDRLEGRDLQAVIHPVAVASLNPQPLPPHEFARLNPQPLPPYAGSSARGIIIVGG